MQREAGKFKQHPTSSFLFPHALNNQALKPKFFGFLGSVDSDPKPILHTLLRRHIFKLFATISRIQFLWSLFSYPEFGVHSVLQPTRYLPFIFTQCSFWRGQDSPTVNMLT